MERLKQETDRLKRKSATDEAEVRASETGRVAELQTRFLELEAIIKVIKVYEVNLLLMAGRFPRNV